MSIPVFAAFCIAYYLIGGVAIGLGLHRLLTHRAFTAPKLLERAIVTLSLPADTPIQWVGNHRFHHAHTDEVNDPHSPNISGFNFVLGWLTLGEGWHANHHTFPQSARHGLLPYSARR